MKPRKYTDIQVLSEVYVSSGGDYEFRCTCNHGAFDYYPDLEIKASRKGKRDYIFWDPPQYVCREVELLIVGLHKMGKLNFYEHTKDGGKRRENLRYHNPELFAKWIESWTNHES